MISNLENRQSELSVQIAQLEADIKNGAGDVSELHCCIADLESDLAFTGKQLADKRLKLKTADRLLAELQDELHTVKEKRDNAQNDYHELTSKH